MIKLMKFLTSFVGAIFSGQGHSGVLIQECSEYSKQVIVREYAQRIPAARVLLIPGAGSRNDDLFLGHIPWGKYFSAPLRFFKENSISTHVFPSDHEGNEGVLERAVRLKNYIKEYASSKDPILLFAHSLGGLTARVALRDPEIRPLVSGLILLSTPNQGSEVVDYVLSERADSKFLRFFSNLIGYKTGDKRYLVELSTSAARQRWNLKEDFSEDLPPILSIISAQKNADLARSIAPLAIGDFVIRETRQVSLKGPALTDGVVTLDSQVWGECLYKVWANHGSVIGKTVRKKEKRVFELLYTKMLKKLRERRLLL